MAKPDMPCPQQAESLAISCVSGSIKFKTIKTEYYGKEKIEKTKNQ